MDEDHLSRRTLLGLFGASIAGTVAGCATAPSAPEPSDPEPEPTTPTDPEPTADNPYVSVYEDVIPSVLLIHAPGGGHGSGFVFDDHLITNYHVVGDAGSIDVRFHGHDWRTARIVGSDPFSDLAILSTDIPSAASSLSLVEAVPPIGTNVVAVGNPFELDSSLSRGIISGVDRSLPNPTGFTIPNVVQTDAIIHPGSSGGPLLTLSGEVVGVIVGGRADGIGFAISAPLVREIAPSLIETGTYDHSYLGVVISPVTPTLATANSLPETRGVYIVEVDADGPSAEALHGSDGNTTVEGTQIPIGGDVIVEIDGHELNTLDELSTVMAFETNPGEEITVLLFRDGERVEETLTVGSRPSP